MQSPTDFGHPQYDAHASAHLHDCNNYYYHGDGNCRNKQDYSNYTPPHRYVLRGLTIYICGFFGGLIGTVISAGNIYVGGAGVVVGVAVGFALAAQIT